MTFSFEFENPNGLQCLKNEDDIGVVYDALEKFLLEYSQ